MRILASVGIEEVPDVSLFKVGQGSGLRLLLPIGFIAIILLALFGLEYYKDWKRKRRMNRIWAKSGRAPK